MDVDSPSGPLAKAKPAALRVESAEWETNPVTGRAREAQSIDVELSRVFLATNDALPVGTVVTLNIRLSEDAPPLTGLARVESVEAGEEGRRPAGMRLQFLDVWGKQANEQLAQYLDEATNSRNEPTSRRWMSGLRVLVVDDDNSYREKAAQAMRDAGFEVMTAANGFEGLSAALKHQPSLILSDVTMPGMDGWQLLRMVRARPTLRRTPVVFLTDLQNDEQRLRGYALGVDDYVAKPFTSVELIARVERVIERAQDADEGVSNGMRGDLSKVPISSLLAFAEMERRTAVVSLAREGEKATLHLKDGAVMRIDLDARLTHLKGLERFFHILEWERGRFELSSTEVTAEDQLGLPTSFALLEHARRRDEAAASS
ncbi:MAG TPA: response regulator [Polyangiales bacterium]|nr:response regulator [Polyangiales bacterium]